MSGILLRVGRLPIDVVLLTGDFLHLTRWRALGLLTALFGVLGPHSGPFCRRRWRSVSEEGSNCTLCGHAQRYGNRFLFRLLCPWAASHRVAGLGRSVVCRRRDTSFRMHPVRYAVAATLIAGFWSGAAAGLMHWLV